MTSRADVLELMALIAVCHRRTAPRLDDEEVTLATATVWADMFSQFQLELPELVAAVKQRALTCTDAPEPADIIRVARAVRQDRIERQGYDTAVIHHRSLATTRSADSPLKAVTRGAHRNETPPVSDKPLTVRCPYCLAQPGRNCIATSTGRPMRRGEHCHPSRIEAAQKNAEQEAASRHDS